VFKHFQSYKKSFAFGSQAGCYQVSRDAKLVLRVPTNNLATPLMMGVYDGRSRHQYSVKTDNILHPPSMMTFIFISFWLQNIQAGFLSAQIFLPWTPVKLIVYR